MNGDPEGSLVSRNSPNSPPPCPASLSRRFLRERDSHGPQCYLGKKRFERAIALYQKTIPNGEADTFSITWKPYYLDPTLPQGKGTPVLERMSSKFGSDRLEVMTKRLSLLGQGEGICFSFQGKMGNTRDAHRLVQLARLKDREGKGNGEVQERLMSALMRGYFEEGGDITSHDMLLDAAAKAGLDREEAKRWLDEGKGGDEVDREVEEAYAKGIRGVPHFIINKKFEISGAQEAETFMAELVRAKGAA